MVDETNVNFPSHIVKMLTSFMLNFIIYDLHGKKYSAIIQLICVFKLWKYEDKWERWEFYVPFHL